MDFELDEDQQALQAAARELLDDRSSSAQVRAVVDAEPPGTTDPKLWAAMVDHGWTAIAVPEEPVVIDDPHGLLHDPYVGSDFSQPVVPAPKY